MIDARYNEVEDTLYLLFTDEVNEIINTAKIVFGLDRDGNISSIGIKDAKKDGIIESLATLLNGIRV